ncbi:DNA packaging tegument protein UL17 [Common bottlenose dolphin gammaherpesvirus 1 strain Sarasota]|uniref:DNA packaging tegument protein UL17 n=1 Tax=Common bottlenose dolphin gammaherpesvirus 1 strain Sarasota TaxID=2022783 RepID=A0A1Z1NEG1_9GAMA|nr:DNA packaging tegument protein UL17 [Common bottlenose dolphin gammaherpesvirus 1 strain Sarasota]ARW78095.1 DNA packaging tegument protein UL17 [Common bottlenose dolphin gammaherpesvirus 1 strain Sarasota]
MDVHAYNHLLLRRAGDRITVHLVISEQLLSRYNIESHKNAKVWCQTRFYKNSRPPTKYVKGVARFLTHADDSLNYPKSTLGGLALSIPLYLETGLRAPRPRSPPGPSSTAAGEKSAVPDDGPTFHPFHVAFVRVFCPDGREEHIPIFYLTLFLALNEAVRHHASQKGPAPPLSTPGQDAGDTTSGAHGPRVDNFYPLTDILRDLDAKNDHSGLSPRARRPHDPATFLSNLLHPRHAQASGDTFRYHQALEEPGQFRGGKSVLPISKRRKPATPRAADPTPICAEDLPAGFGAFHAAETLHAITRERIYVFYYPTPAVPEGTGVIGSAVERLTNDELAQIDPLWVLKWEDSMYATIADDFINSLVGSLAVQRHALHQKLPVSIPAESAKDASAVVTAAFSEACALFHGLSSTAPPWSAPVPFRHRPTAWIRATVAAARGEKGGLWADVIPLWGQGCPVWGKKLASDAPVGGSPDWWVGLFSKSHIKNITCGTHSIGLVVDIRLAAWLILPGGFCIEGRFVLRPDHRDCIVQRHG